MSKTEVKNMQQDKDSNVVELASKELRQLKDEMNALAPVQLNKLELEASWDEIRTGMSLSEKSNPWTLVTNSTWLSMAACAVLVGSLFVGGERTIENMDSTLPALQTENVKSVSDAMSQNTLDVQVLKQFNQLIESRLLALPEQPRLVRANTIDTITRLEDQIALLDFRIDMQEHEPLSEAEYRELWEQRAKSMNGLYQVKAAQVQRAPQPVFERVAYYE